MLPVMVKSYFPPDFTAVDKNLTTFQSLSLGIRQIPDIGLFPNLLCGLRMIEEYVEDHPQYHQCGRGMATDFVPAGTSRLKVYLRYWGESFDEIWDYYTLGGRIPGLDDDKEQIRELMQCACGRDYPQEKIKKESWSEQRRRNIFTTKPTSLYFSLTPDSPYPVPKLYFYPAQKAPNDEAIAQGIDAWMAKNGWHDGEKTLQERVQNVLYAALFLSCLPLKPRYLNPRANELTRTIARIEDWMRSQASSHSLVLGERREPKTSVCSAM